MHSNNTPLEQHLLHNIMALYIELESSQILDADNEKILRENSTAFFAIYNKLYDTIMAEKNYTSFEYLTSLRDRLHDIDHLETLNKELEKCQICKPTENKCEWTYNTIIPENERIEIKGKMIQHWRNIVYRIQWFREKMPKFL